MNISMIGERIRQFREGSGLKVAAFAKIIGIGQGTLSNIENGVSKPSADTLSAIVRHTNIDAVWLLTGEGQGKEKREVDGPGRISPRAEKLVENYEALNEEDKRAIERLAFTVAECQKITSKAG